MSECPPIQSFLNAALNIAVSKFPKNGGNLQPFIDTAKVLLEAGADVHFAQQWGGWNGVSYMPLMTSLTKNVVKIEDKESKMSILKVRAVRAHPVAKRAQPELTLNPPNDCSSSLTSGRI